MLDHPDPGRALTREALAITRARIAGLAKLRQDLGGDHAAVAELTRRLRQAREAERLLMGRRLAVVEAASSTPITARTTRIAVAAPPARWA